MKKSHKLLIVLSVIILFILLSIIPVSIDYQHYIDATRSWVSGKGIYRGEPFYNLPHSIILLYPLSLLPLRIGQGVINLISLISISWALRELVGKISLWALLIVWVNLFTITLFVYGQWDGLILGGVALGWYTFLKRQPVLCGVALSIMCTKPNNVIPVILLLVWLMRNWSVREWLKTALVPFSCLFFSFLAFGMSWPMQYLSHLRHSPPNPAWNISFWSIFPLPIAVLFSITILLWFVMTAKRILTANTGNKNLAIIIAPLTGVILSPYVMGYHYIMATPAIAWLALHSKLLSCLAWIVSFTPLFAEITGFTTIPRYVYPLFIVIGIVFVTARKK